MPAWIDRLMGRGERSAMPALDAKASRVGPALALYMGGRPVWTGRDYASLARSGFQNNPVAHRAVRLVAEAAAATPLVLKHGSVEVVDHPLLALLARPNARAGRQTFLETVYGHLMVSGNAYLEAVSVEGAPRELYALRPDRMTVVPGADGWPVAYDYQAAAQAVRIRQDPDGEGVQPILHIALFNPLDDHYGLAPMEAALTALDIHNAASSWNKALLDNAARPSGALVYAAGEGSSLTDDQFERLKGELEQGFQGAANAGRPLLLDGGLDWNQLCSKDTEVTTASARTSCTTPLPRSPRHTATCASRRPNRARATVTVANSRWPRTTAARRA